MTAWRYEKNQRKNYDVFGAVAVGVVVDVLFGTVFGVVAVGVVFGIVAVGVVGFVFGVVIQLHIASTKIKFYNSIII